jgi:hypothetical protein
MKSNQKIVRAAIYPGIGIARVGNSEQDVLRSDQRFQALLKRMGLAL